MKTYRPTEKDLVKKTYLVDADGKTLGRLASRVASILIGKGKSFIIPGVLCGDQVVIVNARKIRISGKKAEAKVYDHYTGYPGGRKSYTYEDLMAKKPEEIILRAVRRMLPKTRLGSEMLRRCRVYAGEKHRQQAQKPIPLEI